MPATPSPKSSSSKKAGHPHNRPKAPVRGKSGCFTCRIRRKKCDEIRLGNETGPCETCYRLRLECLGFGAKRPDWLRDAGIVATIRDRIKAHLVDQGMIKGHAGTGSRIQIQDLPPLRLSDLKERPTDGRREDRSGSSSSGSPGREESVESDQYAMTPFNYNQSSMRGLQIYEHPDMRCDSPTESLPLYGYQFPAPTSIYSMFPEGFDLETPARTSQLSSLYHARFTIDPEPEYSYDAMNPNPSIIHPSNILPGYLINDSMHEYVNNIVKIQYLLGDKLLLPEMIWEAVSRHTPSKEAVSLLSQAYHSRRINRNSYMLQDEMVKHRVSQLKEMLSAAENKFNTDDAMAALHVVSLYLFDGGQGRWDEFLNFACSYAIRLLEDPHYFGNYPDALEASAQKDQFVIKTTIWFDVLASITTMRPPRLLKYIRQLFQPTLIWVPRKYSMLSPMGCENTVVWALAETSNLSYWKARLEAQGSLSIRHLVNQVQEIEPYLQQGPLPIEPHDSPEDWSRYLTSEIFRTSTRLFLKSVESGDHPHVPEIKECVRDTLGAILYYPPSEAGLDCLTISAIIRSTVFAFYICGSLTDDEQILNVLQSRLTQKPSDEGVGNTTTISELLTLLWDERRTQVPSHPVGWRKLLRKKEILLV